MRCCSVSMDITTGMNDISFFLLSFDRTTLTSVRHSSIHFSTHLHQPRHFGRPTLWAVANLLIHDEEQSIDLALS